MAGRNKTFANMHALATYSDTGFRIRMSALVSDSEFGCALNLAKFLAREKTRVQRICVSEPRIQELGME